MGQVDTGFGLRTGGGGGRSTFNAGTFADLAALNVWGAANLSSLFNSETRVTVASIGRDVYEWSGGDPVASYPSGGSWTLRDIAGEDGQGVDLTGVPDGALLMAQSETAVASAVRETSTTIESTKEILLPGAGSARLSNFDISNNGNNIMARDTSTSRDFIPVAYEITDSGTGRGFREATGVREVTDAAANTSEEFTGNTHQFVIPNTNRGWADRYTFIRSMDALELDDCDITIRYDSHTGPTAFQYTAEANGGEGFTLIAGDGNDETRAPVELVRPAFFETDVIIYVTISSPTGSNLQLRGQTIDFGTVGGVVIGSQQVPYIEVYGRVAAVTPLADTVDIVNSINNGSHSNNVTATATIDNDGNPLINLTVTAGGNGGGGTNPPAEGDVLYHGRSTVSDAATVDVSALTQIDDHTDPQTVSTGVAVQGDYYWIFTESAHDLTTIEDTVLGQDVTTIFQLTSNAQTVSDVLLNARRIGPLNAGVDEQYMLRGFQS